VESYTAQFYRARDVVRAPHTDRETILIEHLAEALSRAEIAEQDQADAEERADEADSVAEARQDEANEAEARAEKAEKELEELRGEEPEAAKRLADLKSRAEQYDLQCEAIARLQQENEALKRQLAESTPRRRSHSQTRSHALQQEVANEMRVMRDRLNGYEARLSKLERR